MIYTRHVRQKRFHVRNLFAYMVWINETDNKKTEIKVNKYIDKLIARAWDDYKKIIEQELKNEDDSYSKYKNIYDYLLFKNQWWFFHIAAYDDGCDWRKETILNVSEDKNWNKIKRMENQWITSILEENNIFFNSHDTLGNGLLSNQWGLIDKIVSYKSGKMKMWDLWEEINYYLWWRNDKLEEKQIKIFDDFCDTFSKALLCIYMDINANKIRFWYDNDPIWDVAWIYLQDRMFDFKVFGEIEIVNFDQLISIVSNYLDKNNVFVKEAENQDNLSFKEYENNLIDAIKQIYTEHNSPIEDIRCILIKSDNNFYDKDKVMITLYTKYYFYQLDIYPNS